MLEALFQIVSNPFAPWGMCFFAILWVGHRANVRLQRVMFSRRDLERRIDTLSSEVATLNQQMRIVSDTLSAYSTIGRGLSELERSIPWQELERAVRQYVQEDRARRGAEAVRGQEQDPPPGRFGNLVDG